MSLAETRLTISTLLHQALLALFSKMSATVALGNAEPLNRIGVPCLISICSSPHPAASGDTFLGSLVENVWEKMARLLI